MRKNLQHIEGFLAIATVFLLLLLLCIAYGQEGFVKPEVEWRWRDYPFSPGLVSSVDVTIINESNVTILLRFVGINLGNLWSKHDVSGIFYGGLSERNRTLAPGERFSYNIGFSVPDDAEGKYRAYILVAYNYNRTGDGWANPPFFVHTLEVEVIKIDSAPLNSTTPIMLITIVIVVSISIIVIHLFTFRKRLIKEACQPKTEPDTQFLPYP